MERIFPGTVQVEVTVRVGEVYRLPESDKKVKVVELITPPNHPWDTLFRGNTDTEGDDLGAGDTIDPVRVLYITTDNNGWNWLGEIYSSPIEEFIRMYVIGKPL